MKKRLEWPRCEPRDTVISLFKAYWPRDAAKAEDVYDTAKADPRTADELLEAHRWRKKPKLQPAGDGGG